jgi:hypothetical protein
VGAEPSASAWPIGREFVVTVPRPGAETARPGPVERSGRAEVVPEVPATATGTDAGKGKGRQEPVTYSRAVTPQRGGGSGSRPVASTYRISGDGQVILPDGSPGGRALDPAGWVRFGADFFHPESGGFLHGDDGWLGRVGNADELRAALNDPSLPHFTAVPYRLWVDSAAIYLSPAIAGAGPIVRIPLSPDDESGTETLPASKTAHAPRHEPGGRTAGELVQHFDDVLNPR